MTALLIGGVVGAIFVLIVAQLRLQRDLWELEEADAGGDPE